MTSGQQTRRDANYGVPTDARCSGAYQAPFPVGAAMRRPPSTLQKLPHRSGEVPAQQGIGCPERHGICVCIVRSAPPACGHLPIAMGRLWAGGAKAKILEDFRFRLSAKLFLTIHRIGKITSPPLRTSTGHRSPATGHHPFLISRPRKCLKKVSFIPIQGLVTFL